jgi:hypothetical protein
MGIARLFLPFVAASIAASATFAADAPPLPRVTMQQLMRGIYFPAANVLFSAQDDVTKLPQADDPSTSPNPLTSVYGGWLAVEDAALALLDARALLDRPGRLCSNKRVAAVQSEQWKAFSRLMSEAAVAAYKAARTHDTNKMVDVAGTLSDACDACHKVFRDRPVPGKPAGIGDICPTP